jgi:ribosome-binding factor A
LRVEVAADVRTAKVYVSIMGTEKERALCLHGLNASRGFLQSKIADRIETRYTPVLKFVLDDAVSSTAEEAVRILQELEDERRQRDGESVASADEESDDVNESEALLDSDVLIHETEDEDE